MAKSALSVKNITKVFDRPVLRDLSFEVTTGECVALVGANGAGKSTLLKCLMGLIYTELGDIFFFDKKVTDSAERAEHVAFLPELVSFWPEATPVEILGLCRRHLSLKELQQTLEGVGLKGKEFVPVAKFSKGMVQRLGLASLLIQNVPFLILDEPMTGLDFRAQEWLRHFLLDWRKKDKTLLISTHSLRDVEMLADRVLVLENGQLIMNGKKEDILPKLYESREQLT